MGQIVLRQSLIKALDEEKQQCPAKAKAIYIDGMQSKASDAMIRGLHFETLLYGSTDTGELVYMERNKNGAKSESEVRVEFHAHNVKTKLRQEMQMDFKRPREVITVEISPKYLFKASLDMVTSFRMPNGDYIDEAILDFKITDSILNSYGPFAWGVPHTMDHTQAFAYTWAYKVKHKKHVPFFYLVMDLSPQKNYKFVGGYVGKTELAEFKESVRRTIASIEDYEAKGKWPEVPSMDNCRGCPLRASCPAAQSGAHVQILWDGL